MPRCIECDNDRWDDDGRCMQCRAFPTLGYQIGEFIEEKCAIPDRDEVGEPYILTQWQWVFLLNFYRINPHAVKNDRGSWVLPFKYSRGAQLTLPQRLGRDLSPAR